MMSRVRVGFIGAGGNTRLRHLPGFARLAEVELVAVANRTRDSAQRVATEFGVARVAHDWREIIAADDVDAVCIGTWPNTHAAMTLAALAAGKHVLVEARMASSLAEAIAMEAAAHAQPHLVTQIVPSPLTLEADDLIREVVNSGALGELRGIRSDYATAATLDPHAPRSWRQDFSISGINTMALGICYEPLRRWLPGDALVRGARADVLTPWRRDDTGRRQKVEIPERLEVEAAWGDARLTMTQSTVEPGPPRCGYVLEGSRATLHYEVNERTLSLRPHNGSAQQIEIPPLPDGGWAVEEQFVASIRSGAPVTLTDFAAGVGYMRFTDAVWRAWSSPST